MKRDLGKFKGIFMAMYSAYDDNGNVDKERVKKLARYYADKKVKGLYVGGSSGEGVLQSEEERKQVVEAVMEEVKGELTIIVHVGANSTAESVRLAQHAEKMGADAVSSIPAVYYRLSPESVKVHWQAMIDSTSLPFIIYHIPQTTGFNLPMCLFEEMAKQDAGIGGTYGVMPELFMKLDEYMKKQEVEKARELQDKVNEIIKGLLSVGSLYGACKYILDLRGIKTGVPRLPLLPITDDKKKEFLKELNEKILKLVEEVK